MLTPNFVEHRLLSVEDTELVAEFSDNTSESVAGAEVPAEIRAYGEYLRRGKPEDTFRAFGAVVTQPSGKTVLDAVLLSCLSNAQPTWYLTALYGRESRLAPNSLRDLFAWAVRYHETTYGYNRFSMLYPADKVGAYQRLFGVEPVSSKQPDEVRSFRDRTVAVGHVDASGGLLYGTNVPVNPLGYVGINELVVPAGVRPPYHEIFVLLMSRMLWQQDMVVRTLVKVTEESTTR